jgi:hypothetical protein
LKEKYPGVGNKKHVETNCKIKKIYSRTSDTRYAEINCKINLIIGTKKNELKGSCEE